MRTSLVVAALLLLTINCSSFTDVSRELDIAVSADRTTVPAGENLRVTYEATGAFLTRIVVDFGDGSEQAQINTGGAQSASGNVVHSYGQPGTYKVTGVAFEASGANTRAEITIEVSPASP